MKARLTTLSRADACAHLLRHLNDAAAVRCNPLVEHFFPEQRGGARLLSVEREALERVRALVRAAAEALRDSERHEAAAIHVQRQYAILMRCDLQQERHQDVASDLGLSLSQFYRERRSARDWVARYLLDYRERPLVTAITEPHHLDRFVFEINHARTLRNAGDYDAAVELLQNLSDTLDSSAQRLEVYCLLVKFLYDARRYGEIHLALQAARECFANVRLSAAPDIALHQGRLEDATADYFWAIGDSVSALAAHERSVHAFETVRFRPTTDGEDALVHALLDLVHGYVSVGRFNEAHATIARARAVIDELESPGPRLRAGYLVGLGFIQTTRFDTMGDAVATLRSAQEIASRYRLAHEAIMAMAGLSINAQYHGDFATATGYVKECLSLGERILPPIEQSNLLLRLCELHAVSGNPQEAIALAARVREHFAPESSGWMRATIFSAMASYAAGDYPTALQLSQRASEVASRKSDFRLHGAALRVQAAACAGMGFLDTARSSIERAVDVLEAHGSPYILLLGYEDSSRITGNGRHRASALELRSTVFRTTALAAPI